jgi:hypothetical protein
MFNHIADYLNDVLFASMQNDVAIVENDNRCDIIFFDDNVDYYISWEYVDGVILRTCNGVDTQRYS